MTLGQPICFADTQVALLREVAVLSRRDEHATPLMVIPREYLFQRGPNGKPTNDLIEDAHRKFYDTYVAFIDADFERRLLTTEEVDE